MPRKATVTVHPAYRIGDISPRLYGSFLEPIGSMVNGTMYNPKHPSADDKGFRGDVINALRETHVPAVRLPGGNFVSGWDWKDSIGPKDQRKAHLDLAWHQYIPNDVGLDEYLHISGFAGWSFVEHIQMYTDDLDAANTYENPNALVPGVCKDSVFAGGKVTASLKKLSWNIFRFRKS